jgi:uncharacterized OsmC-like protein
MSEEQIKKSIEAAVDYLGKHPDEARYTDGPATAKLESGLRFNVAGPDGLNILTDMPKGVGGEGANPGPGWLLRAALASCMGSLIAMRAAQTDMRLSKLEVVVDSESDDRGILGIDESVPAGPITVRIKINIAAEGATDKALKELATWAEGHCPVIDAIRRPVAISVEVMPSFSSPLAQ